MGKRISLLAKTVTRPLSLVYLQAPLPYSVFLPGCQPAQPAPRLTPAPSAYPLVCLLMEEKQDDTEGRGDSLTCSAGTASQVDVGFEELVSGTS